MGGKTGSQQRQQQRSHRVYPASDDFGRSGESTVATFVCSGEESGGNTCSTQSTRRPTRARATTISFEVQQSPQQQQQRSAESVNGGVASARGGAYRIADMIRKVSHKSGHIVGGGGSRANHLHPNACAKESSDMFDGASAYFEELAASRETGFGWITGVLIRCILCIFGATLFLRMSWIAGQAGLLLGMAVILLSLLVVMITAISMSAIATNGEVKSGGCYYLISRSLGPEFGGSIGLILYIANTVNASMNVVGLAETVVVLLQDYNFALVDGGKNDIRIYALGVCIVLQLIIFIGTEFENKTQMLLLVSIVVSIGSHFVGTLLPITDFQRQRGVVGYSLSVFMENLWPDFGHKESFIVMFGVYFPAMTGIMAGANMSGDLRDPSKSIPRGTFWAIVITTATYSWCMITSSSSTLRDATGNSEPLRDAETGHYLSPLCRQNESCSFGLRNDYQVMALQGAWSPLIVIGIFATTLSSASGCLIGAPRIFQALSADKLFPLIHPFAKGNGPNNDPFRAYFLTLFIACSVILIGELNAIADLITNFFLAAFAITNFACFDASAAKSPGFRPGFRFYNKWLSLFGSALCVIIMFVLSWLISLITLFILLILFVFIKHNKSHINWGTSTEANRYRKALSCLLKITRTEAHVKNYRPQLLVLTGNPAARQALVDFAYCISNGQNLLLCGHVIPHKSSVSATAIIRQLNNRLTDWLHDQRIKAFYCAVANVSLRAGVQSLLQTVGLGKMQPNILLLGYNNKWLEQSTKHLARHEEYVGVIWDALQSNMSIAVFRNENDGLDHSALLSEVDQLFVRLPDLLSMADRESALNDDLSRGVEPALKRPNANNRQLLLSGDSARTNLTNLHLPLIELSSGLPLRQPSTEITTVTFGNELKPPPTLSRSGRLKLELHSNKLRTIAINSHDSNTTHDSNKLQLSMANRESALNDDLSRGVEPALKRPKANNRQLLLSGDSARTNLTNLHLPLIELSSGLPLRQPSTEITTVTFGNELKPPPTLSRSGRLKLELHRSISSNSTAGAGIRKYDLYDTRPPLNMKFRTQIRGGFVDVWWLFDDGGLTLLLSYLLTTHNTYLPNAKLRVFTICSLKTNPDAVHDNLVKMLKKFRIQFSAVHAFAEQEVGKKLYQETIEEYQMFLEALNGTSGEKPAISQDILERTQERTNRYLRQRELLLEYSSASSVVLITLPVAPEHVMMSPIYMLWLELLSRDMPPTLFVRGNQASVITHYS